MLLSMKMQIAKSTMHFFFEISMFAKLRMARDLTVLSFCLDTPRWQDLNHGDGMDVKIDVNIDVKIDVNGIKIDLVI